MALASSSPFSHTSSSSPSSGRAPILLSPEPSSQCTIHCISLSKINRSRFRWMCKNRVMTRIPSALSAIQPFQDSRRDIIPNSLNVSHQRHFVRDGSHPPHGRGDPHGPDWRRGIQYRWQHVSHVSWDFCYSRSRTCHNFPREKTLVQQDNYGYRWSQHVGSQHV